MVLDIVECRKLPIHDGVNFGPNPLFQFLEVFSWPKKRPIISKILANFGPPRPLRDVHFHSMLNFG